MPTDKGTNSDPGTFPVGRIVGFQGLDGYLKIRPTCNNHDLLLDLKKVEIVFPTGNSLEELVSEIYVDRKMLFMQLQRYPDRTSVEKFLNCSVSTTRSQLRELGDNEWWIDDLIGLPVYTTSGAQIGTISDIIGANAELLEIKRLNDSPGEPFLVPFVEALVPLVDIKAKRIEVTDLPGLLDY